MNVVCELILLDDKVDDETVSFAFVVYTNLAVATNKLTIAGCGSCGIYWFYYGGKARHIYL